MIIKGLKVLTVHQLFLFVQILPLYMQTQWFHLYVVLFGMKKDQLQFKKKTSLNRSFVMYYIKYGQQIIMNLIIIESIQTKIYQRFQEIYFHFCTYICLIYLMVRKWIQHDTSLLGLSRFRHGSVRFGSGNKTSVLGFFQFSFILCYKNGITQWNQK